MVSQIGMCTKGFLTLHTLKYFICGINIQMKLPEKGYVSESQGYTLRMLLLRLKYSMKVFNTIRTVL